MRFKQNVQALIDTLDASDGYRGRVLEVRKQLHLQLLVVTPSDKIQIVENFIAHVHLVQRVGNRHSVLFNMTKKELKQRREIVVNP